MSYPFTEIEKKWQKFWIENKTFKTKENFNKPKYYVLDMFPYPSGAGLHVGHPEGYTATDIIARYKRLNGFSVLHPMGWDAFGLPAEQYAIETGTHPKVTTEKNIKRFREQLQAIGFSYDWDREVNTTDPDYYKWTQWIFLQLYKKGLAYLADVPVNWCPALGTVLANEEVIDGKSERGGHPVYRRPMRQWMLKITEYAERLLKDLEDLDWPESTKEMQHNWIGKSEGAEVDFKIENSSEVIRVFTTRPDTLFGATYMVMSPEHPLLDKITSVDFKEEVEKYRKEAASKSDLERTELSKKKTGVFSGAFAINPVNNKKIPVWIADYVLMGYGTGAIMAVPGQDERDWEFAEIYNLQIIRTVQPPKDFEGKAYLGDGPAINSDFLNGLNVSEAKEKITQWLENKKLGQRKTNYKLRDWLFSRQRYWGEPFPVLHDPDNNDITLVKEKDLPVTLPEMVDFKPQPTSDSKKQPQPPLSRADDEWKYVEIEGVLYHREFNTMPQWAGSCWYYLRFIDPQNPDLLVDVKKEKYWMPVDLYIGGSEHSVLHLLYARFWHKVLYDIGVVSTEEPFKKLVHQGMILGEQEYTAYKNESGDYISFDKIKNTDPEELNSMGITSIKLDEDVIEKQGDLFILKENPQIRIDARAYKMSKSRGNVINPDDVIYKYGSDALRLYEMFMGPLESMKPWSMRGVDGISRFLNRVWRLCINDEGNIQKYINEENPSADQLKQITAVIKKVTEDIENLRFNTAISAMMIFINESYKWKNISKRILKDFFTIMNPFAPHITEELWQKFGFKKTVTEQSWPTYDEKYLEEDQIEWVIQVNGKIRERMFESKSLNNKEIEQKALAFGRTFHDFLL